MIDGTEKPIRSLQTRMRYNEFGYKLNKRCFLPSSNFNTLILSHSISSSKACVKVQEKKKKVVVLCFHPPQKGTFMSQSCSHGKEMYTKALRTCKVLPLLNLFLSGATRVSNRKDECLWALHVSYIFQPVKSCQKDGEFIHFNPFASLPTTIKGRRYYWHI